MKHKRIALVSFLIVLFVVLADQSLKNWVHTRMFYGQELHVTGNWFLLHYIENNGMAFGYEFGGEYGKIFLTVFRIVAVIGGVFLIRYCILNRFHHGLIVCLSFVLGGATGNIIDSVFYGIIYGYAPLFHGRVIDMLYFPLIHSRFPSWVPVVGSQEFTFFDPVFNIADSAISTSVFWMLIFQKTYFKNALPTAQGDPNSEMLEV